MPRSSQQTCARCGSPVEAGEVLCARCREEEPAPVRTQGPSRRSALEERSRRWPASMARPSPVQYHATVMVAVFLVLVGLAVFAFLSNRGVGPFTGTAASFSFRGEATLQVIGTVRNDGSKRARANCRAVALTGSGSQIATDTFLTGMIEPETSIPFRASIDGVNAEPARVLVFCS